VVADDRPRLLVRLGSLGDVVLATAAAAAWKRTLGAAPLDVLVKEPWADVWGGHPAVRRVIPWPAGASPGSVRADLRPRGYAEVLDLQNSLRTRALTRGLGVGLLPRPRRYGVRRRLLVHWKRFGPPADYGVRRSFLAAVDPGADDLPSVHPVPAARARAAEILGAGGNPVALVPGSRHATKRWPEERFRELAASLAGTERTAVLLGPDDEVDRTGWPGDTVFLREPLGVAAAVLARCATAVTGDTGLMHVAAAVGTPVVALFGPTVRAFGFFPSGPGHRVLERDLACRPCSVHGSARCPLGHFRCLLDITTDTVRAAVLDAIAATAGSAG